MKSLAQLKELSGWESKHEDCTIERFDGIDLDTALEPELRRQWLQWLDEADLDQLELVEVSSELVPRRRGTAGLTVVLPEEYRRLVAVRVLGWTRRAEIIDADSGDRRLRCLGNDYALPGPEHPIAVCRHREYELIPAPPADMAGQLILEAVAVRG